MSTPCRHISAFPAVLRNFVGVGALSLGCDESYIAVPMLAAAASAIGNTRRIRLKRDWTEPPVIWAAVVAESGTVKSSAFELAIRPVWKRQRAILKESAQARADYATELKTWKDTPKGARGAQPEQPTPCEHPLCSDITVEALADRLLATPRGTLIALDELAGWFGSFNQYKSGGADVPHWLAMHGARALKVDRKGGDRTTIYVPHAAVSVTGTIQPATLKRLLVPEFFDNGLSARLLVTMPPTKAKKWNDREIDQATADEVDRLFSSLYALKPCQGVSGDDEPVMVDLTDAARETWAAFVNRHNESLQDLEGAARAASAKLEGYAARIALVFHCVQQASGEKDSEYIEAADIESGIIVAEWFGEETRRVYFAMHENPVSRRRRELIEWIAGRGGRATVRDLQRNLRRYERDADQAESELSQLVDLGLGAWSYQGEGLRGRPTRVFCLAESPDFPITKTADADINHNSNGKPALTSAGNRDWGLA